MLGCPHRSTVHCIDANVVWITQHPKGNLPLNFVREPHGSLNGSESKLQINILNRPARMTCATSSWWGLPAASKGERRSPSCWTSGDAAPWQSGCASCMQWVQQHRPHTVLCCMAAHPVLRLSVTYAHINQDIAEFCKSTADNCQGRLQPCSQVSSCKSQSMHQP